MLLVMLSADYAEQMHRHNSTMTCIRHTARRWPATISHNQAEFKLIHCTRLTAYRFDNMDRPKQDLQATPLNFGPLCLL